MGVQPKRLLQLRLAVMRLLLMLLLLQQLGVHLLLTVEIGYQLRPGRGCGGTNI